MGGHSQFKVAGIFESSAMSVGISNSDHSNLGPTVIAQRGVWEVSVTTVPSNTVSTGEVWPSQAVADALEVKKGDMVALRPSG